MTPTPESSAVTGASGAAGESLSAGRYVITGSLGSGSQGETLDAVDKREGRAVAIKRFALRSAKSWKDVELAEREATVLSALNHPGLPRYVEHFEEDGALYLVMEKIEGETLAARRKRGHALSHEQVVRFLSDAAACLRYLHGHAPPIVHRDIKPGNVLLRPDGSYCLVDFGSVRDRLKPEGGSTVVGTFGYMAPEQFQGRAAPGSDVYAVAATALSLLTGREPEELPHQGLAIDVEAALRGQADRRLVAALRGMLEPDPDRRTPSVDAALQRSGLLGGARPSAKEERKERWSGGVDRAGSTHPAEEQLRRTFERQRKQLERQQERQQRHRSEKQQRKQRKAERKQTRRAERDARGYAGGQWRRPHRPVPPGILVGVVVLVALRIASVATFALFSVLLPLLFTIIAVPGRRERMQEIGRAGQRGLSRARQHIRYQFLGGPVPDEVRRFLDAMEQHDISRRVDDDAERPRRRVSVDVEAEEAASDEPEPADSAREDVRQRR
ncbi:MAG: serine/threonine protein kinase [Myxococcales bacterium]|nr:MAG: serine/threonine protein kinase [Myxococcales bacterium]